MKYNEGYFRVNGIAVSGVNFVRYCGIEFLQHSMRYCTKINIQISCNAIFLKRNNAT